MATSSSTLRKAIGLALFVCGLGLLYWGHQLSGSLASQLTKSLNGALPNEVMYRYVGGAAAAVVGLFLLVKK